MMHAYTRPRTIDLVLADVCANPIGTLIEDAVRSIAARIGRSAGGITPALKRLAADGWISYLADGRGTLIEVLKSDQQTDRSVSSVAPPPDAPIALECSEPPPSSDQQSDRQTSDQIVDRSLCMVLRTQDQNQEEEIARTPLFDRLLAQPDMNPQLATKIAQHPPGTLADFEADLKIAQTMPRITTPFYFTVSKWEQQQRVIAPQEHTNERSPAAQRSAGTRRESSSHRSRRNPDPAPAVDYAALRAEIAALPYPTAEELGLPVPRSWRDAYAT